MRRFLTLLLLITISSENGEAKQSLLNHALPENQFRMESYRGYFRVVESGQAGDLIVHSAPSENSPKILSVEKGTIAMSDGTTARADGTTWLRVAIEGEIDRIGWIHIRNLRHAQPTTYPGTTLAVAGFCAGYDPVWGFRWDGSAARLDTFPGKEKLSISTPSVTSVGASANFSATNQEMAVEAVFDGHACVPSNIEGLIGTSALIIMISGEKRRMLSGCCQVSANAFAQ